MNHVLLSYQKHHAPSQQRIPEQSADGDQNNLRVIKPLFGIEMARF